MIAASTRITVMAISSEKLYWVKRIALSRSMVSESAKKVGDTEPLNVTIPHRAKNRTKRPPKVPRATARQQAAAAPSTDCASAVQRQVTPQAAKAVCQSRENHSSCQYPLFHVAGVIQGADIRDLANYAHFQQQFGRFVAKGFDLTAEEFAVLFSVLPAQIAG